MPSTLVAEVDPAVLTLVGTLTGIVVTALFGLLTAYLAQRWQFTRSEPEQRFQVDRELREARRETYARYIASAQQVFVRRTGAPVAWQAPSVEATAASPIVCTAIAGHPRVPGQQPARRWSPAPSKRPPTAGSLLSLLALLAVSYPALTAWAPSCC